MHLLSDKNRQLCFIKFAYKVLKAKHCMHDTTHWTGWLLYILCHIYTYHRIYESKIQIFLYILKMFFILCMLWRHTHSLDDLTLLWRIPFCIVYNMVKTKQCRLLLWHRHTPITLCIYKRANKRGSIVLEN